MTRKILGCLLFCFASLLAQFKAGDTSLGGSVSYERNYWNKEAQISIFGIQPECNYFILNNFSLQIIGLTSVYIYPKDWSSNPDSDLGFGLGAKYFLRSFYIGSSFVYKRWNNIPARHDLLIEAGYLQKLNQKVFLDLGCNYTTGISDVNRKISKVKLELGIVAFL